jgi:hypothetical protein
MVMMTKHCISNLERPVRDIQWQFDMTMVTGRRRTIAGKNLPQVFDTANYRLSTKVSLLVACVLGISTPGCG